MALCRHTIHLLGAIMLCLPSVSRGTTRYVPQEYVTIQAAIDASSFGDTVLVAPGTYTDWQTRNLEGLPWTACVFLKDGVVIRSETGSASTIIDFGQGVGPQSYVIIGLYIESEITALEGFTITSIGSPHQGALILGPIILRECVFRNLTAGTSDGGGLVANYPKVINCLFENCKASGGGAIYHSAGRIELIGSTIRNCGRIGALLSGTFGEPVESALIENCIIEFCWNDLSGGAGMQIGDHYQGGAEVRNCIFRDNSDRGSGGGGLALGGFGPKLVEDCLFLRNATAGIGGAIASGNVTGEVRIRQNTFYGNAANISGGAAIAIMNPGDTFISNNVVAGALGGGAMYGYNVAYESICNVFWDNENGVGKYYTPGPTDQIIDPLFCDIEMDDFTVDANSPCLPENSPVCGQIGAFGQGCGTIGVEIESWGKIKAKYLEGKGAKR